MSVRSGVVPTLFVEAESVPEAHYKAIEAVWNRGLEKRTQYDRKDPEGNYIDPPGKDAQVLVKINDPFAQPRFPPLSFCERGKYILEILGVKDNLVIPMEKILQGVDESKLGTEWPYTYHQRLAAHPTQNGTVDQIENVVERISSNTDSRRAVMTTRTPEIDTMLKEDIPCLGEIHFRCFESDDGRVALNMATVWRSRDLFKAWADNVIALTYLGTKVADRIAERTGREVFLGGYTDFSNSLHIYGQDFAQIETDEAKRRRGFFEVFPDAAAYVRKSWDSETAREVEVIPQMEALLGEQHWKFTDIEVERIRTEIDLLKSGRLP